MTFTDKQRAEIEQMIHDAIKPVAKQLTEWVQKERARLADPRRRPTGATSKPQGRLVPDHTKNKPPLGEEPPPAAEPTVHIIDQGGRF